MECTADETERWNKEWLRYLEREWQHQLKPHSEFPGRPELPDDPRELLGLRVGGPPLRLYCHGSQLTSKRVMEMGCGCGNLGKLVSWYAESYLGVDYSTLALAVARLVSPENCTYIHVADRQRLKPFFGTIDTVISRHFWIHQNLKLARMNLEILAAFLKSGGRLYADFFWPDPSRFQFKVFSPNQPLSKKHPSATFKYTEADVQRAIDGLPFRVVEQAVSVKEQARYVVLERD